MSRRKKIQENEGANEEWLQTYADTITLVLTFFVLLYSFSNIDAIKFKQLSSSLQSVLTGQNSNSILEFNHDGQVPIVGPPEEMGSQDGRERENIYAKAKAIIDANKLEDSVQIKKDSRGIILELKDSVLFDIGRAEIKNDSRPILDKLGVLIASLPNEIVIEGHTDNVPIHNMQYPSNWELSTQRAVNVLKYFVQNKGMDPKKFQAAGYGEYRPIAPNDTYGNKAKNRRVNILIIAREKEKK